MPSCARSILLFGLKSGRKQWIDILDNCCLKGDKTGWGGSGEGWDGAGWGRAGGRIFMVYPFVSLNCQNVINHSNHSLLFFPKKGILLNWERVLLHRESQGGAEASDSTVSHNYET